MQSKSDSVQRAVYASLVTISPTSPPNDYGIVAVIDGSELQILRMNILLTDCLQTA